MSGKMSTGITKINIKAINQGTPNTKFNIVKFDHLVRKNADFFVNLVLGVFVINAFRKSGIGEYKCVVFVLLFVFFTLQAMNYTKFLCPAEVQDKDVIIDSAGASVGIFVNKIYTSSAVFWLDGILI